VEARAEDGGEVEVGDDLVLLERAPSARVPLLTASTPSKTSSSWPPTRFAYARHAT
jgi:hypothetical protein